MKKKNELEFNFNTNEVSSGTLQNESEELKQDDDESKPPLLWLHGLPDQATLERCRKLTELSKTLKYQKYGANYIES